MEFIGRVLAVFVSLIARIAGFILIATGIIALIFGGPLWWIAFIVAGLFIVAIAIVLRKK